MPNRPPLNEREQSELVAYLDNELSDQAARRVEARLHQDDRFRGEAEALKQVWDLLDHLPQAEPSREFTHRTLERLTLTQQRPVLARPPLRRRPWVAGVAWAAAMMLATWVGFAGFDALTPRPPSEKELVRDLRLIENKRLYDLIDDLEFLQELDHPDLFGDDKVATS